MSPQGYYALANWDGSLSTRPPSPLPPLPSPPPQPSEAVVSVSTVSVHGRTSMPPLTDTSIQHSKQPEPHVRMALSRHRGTANANAIANTHAPGTAMGRLAYADSSESSVELPIGERDAGARRSDSVSHYQSEQFLHRHGDPSVAHMLEDRLHTPSAPPRFHAPRLHTSVGSPTSEGDIEGGIHHGYEGIPAVFAGYSDKHPPVQHIFMANKQALGDHHGDPIIVLDGDSPSPGRVRSDTIVARAASEIRANSMFGSRADSALADELIVTIPDTSRASSEATHTDVPASTVAGTVSMLHVSDLERDMSVVPETPEHSPPPGSKRSVSSALHDSSAGETTLVASSAKANQGSIQFVWRAYTPSKHTADIVPESPLSSLSSLSSPIRSSSQPMPVLTAPVHRAYVAVPRLPPATRKEEYTSMDAYIARTVSNVKTNVPPPLPSIARAYPHYRLPVPEPFQFVDPPPSLLPHSQSYSHIPPPPKPKAQLKRKRSLTPPLAAASTSKSTSTTTTAPPLKKPTLAHAPFIDAKVSASNAPRASTSASTTMGTFDTPRPQPQLKTKHRLPLPHRPQASDSDRISVTNLQLESLGAGAHDTLHPFSTYVDVKVDVWCEAELLNDRVADVAGFMRSLCRHVTKEAELVPVSGSASTSASGQIRTPPPLANEDNPAPSTPATYDDEPRVHALSYDAHPRAHVPQPQPQPQPALVDEPPRIHPPPHSTSVDAGHPPVPKSFPPVPRLAVSASLNALGGYGSSSPTPESSPLVRTTNLLQSDDHAAPYPLETPPRPSVPSPSTRHFQTPRAQTDEAGLVPEKALAFMRAQHPLDHDHDGAAGGAFLSMRGHDAFLCGDSGDVGMGMLRSEVYGSRESSEHEQESGLFVDPWDATGQRLEEGFFGMQRFQLGGGGESTGTIDPRALLGPVASPVAAPIHTPSPTPSPVRVRERLSPLGASSERVTGTDEQRQQDQESGLYLDHVQEATHDQSLHEDRVHPHNDNDHLSPTSTLAAPARVKERGARPVTRPHTIFALAPDVNRVASEVSTAHVVDGKRHRMPTFRGREAGLHGLVRTGSGRESIPAGGNGHEDDNDDGVSVISTKTSTGKGKGKGKSKSRPPLEITDGMLASTGEGPSNLVIHKLATEDTYCHQCRHKTRLEKMRCTMIRKNGVPCGLRFCQRCVLVRYPGMEFDAFARVFECPKCADTCNCTGCCARRGETYVSTRNVKVSIPGYGRANSSNAKTVTKPKTKQAGSKSKGKHTSAPWEHESASSTSSSSPSPSPTPSTSASEEAPAPHALPQGALWGTVYAVSGRERMGVGFVLDEGSQRIGVLDATTGGTGKTRRPRQFIGVPQKGWKLAPVEFEGEEGGSIGVDEGDVGEEVEAERGARTVHACVGSVRTIYRWHDEQCFGGDLTPPPSEEEVEGGEKHQESPSSASGSGMGSSGDGDMTATPVPLEDLTFILANALHLAASTNTSDGGDGSGS